MKCSEQYDKHTEHTKSCSSNDEDPQYYMTRATYYYYWKNKDNFLNSPNKIASVKVLFILCYRPALYRSGKMFLVDCPISDLNISVYIFSSQNLDLIAPTTLCQF